jgi:Ca-activated chloride channel homolog
MLIHFSHPWFLLLIPSALLLSWSWLRRRPRALPFPSTESLTGLPGGRATWARWGGAGLRCTALTLLILALAGLRWPDPGTRISTEGIAIALVVDVSGSMAERDFNWGTGQVSRMDAVKRACKLFVVGGDMPGELSGRRSDLICLVTFATRPEGPCPLTLSHSVLLRMLDAEQPRRVPTESETNIGDAIAWGLLKLESAGNREKVLLLLTDGEHNVPPPALTPRKAAQIAGSLRVPVYVIDVGGKPSSLEAKLPQPPQPKESGATGVQSLQAVAALTGGRYFHAGDSDTLLTACQDIDRLERQEIESFQYRRFYEAYPWLGLVSLVLFLSVSLLENSLWLRIP